MSVGNSAKVVPISAKGRSRGKAASSSFTCMDLFCGAGGVAEGFRQAGFRTVVANDIDKWAGATFTYNHARHGTRFVLGDITDRATKEEILGNTGGIPIDVITGGPPCQAFSQVRNHKRIIHDPRNALYRHFVEMIGLVKPPLFLLENVPGLENIGRGAVRQQILEDLALDGEYEVESRVVDAASFGVPQNRLRVLFVGIRRDLHFSPPFPAADLTELPILQRIRQRKRFVYHHAKDDGRAVLEKLLDPECEALVTVEQAISDLAHLRPSEKLLRYPSDEAVPYETFALSAYQRARRMGSATLYNADVPSIREDTVARLGAIPKGGNFRDIPERLTARYLNGKKWGPELGRENLSRKYFFAYRKLHPDHFSWTLNTKADCVYHFDAPRALSVREFARLHSFDDTYHFLHGDRHSRYRQVGNAVPPLLARAVANAMRTVLEAHSRQTRRRASGSRYQSTV